MKLQVASHLAIYALIELAADSERQISVAEMGEKYGVSAHHLAKVMHTLGRANLVRSVRGAGGGYQFCGNARRTTLLDIVQLFENFAGDNTLVDGQAEATEAGQALGQVLDEIDDIARATLGSINIATMIRLIARRRARGAQAPAADSAARV
jgi:Rrf2 family protein